MGKTWLLKLNYFYRVNLSEISVECQIIFQLGIAGSTSIHEKKYHKVSLPKNIKVQ